MAYGNRISLNARLKRIEAEYNLSGSGIVGQFRIKDNQALFRRNVRLSDKDSIPSIADKDLKAFKSPLEAARYIESKLQFVEYVIYSYSFSDFTQLFEGDELEMLRGALVKGDNLKVSRWQYEKEKPYKDFVKRKAFSSWLYNISDGYYLEWLTLDGHEPQPMDSGFIPYYIRQDLIPDDETQERYWNNQDYTSNRSRDNKEFFDEKGGEWIHNIHTRSMFKTNVIQLLHRHALQFLDLAYLAAINNVHFPRHTRYELFLVLQDFDVLDSFCKNCPHCVITYKSIYEKQKKYDEFHREWDERNNFHSSTEEIDNHIVDLQWKYIESLPKNEIMERILKE
jgi:hypothetical protein